MRCWSLAAQNRSSEYQSDMRRYSTKVTVLTTLAVVASASAMTAFSYWLYGSAIGVQWFVFVNTPVVAMILAAPLIHAWVGQTEQLRVTKAQLECVALFDLLTGLPNRRAFFEFADAVFARSQSTQHAVLMIDVDDFKSINDGFGQAAGDAVLVIVAKSLRSVFEESCVGDSMVARIGSDVFAALVSGRTSDQVLSMVEGLRAVIRSMTPDYLDGQALLTLSIGVAFCLPDTSTEAALMVADDARRRAKRGGRDRWLAAAQGGTRILNRVRRRSEQGCGPGRAARSPPAILL